MQPLRRVMRGSWQVNDRLCDHIDIDAWNYFMRLTVYCVLVVGLGMFNVMCLKLPKRRS